jgi:hypothetical protein
MCIQTELFVEFVPPRFSFSRQISVSCRARRGTTERREFLSREPQLPSAFAKRLQVLHIIMNGALDLETA